MLLITGYRLSQQGISYRPAGGRNRRSVNTSVQQPNLAWSLAQHGPTELISTLLYKLQKNNWVFIHRRLLRKLVLVELFMLHCQILHTAWDVCVYILERVKVFTPHTRIYLCLSWQPFHGRSLPLLLSHSPSLSLCCFETYAKYQMWYGFLLKPNFCSPKKMVINVFCQNMDTLGLTCVLLSIY